MSLHGTGPSLRWAMPGPPSGELLEGCTGGCPVRPPHLISGPAPCCPQRPPASRVQPHARLPAFLVASLFPGSAMASSSVLTARTSSAVSGTHPVSWGTLGSCAAQASRGPGALGSGGAGQAIGNSAFAGSACVASCKDIRAPEILGNICGMRTHPGTYAPWALPAPILCQDEADSCCSAIAAGPSDCVLSPQMLPVAGTPMSGSVTMAGVFLAAGAVMVLLTAWMALMSRTVVCTPCERGRGAGGWGCRAGL